LKRLQLNSLLLVLIMTTIAYCAFAQFAGGDGTSQDPYQISNASQLNSVRNFSSSHFILTEYIDMSPELMQGELWYDQNSGWVPISLFTGNFNGDGYTISNLTMNRIEWRQALFAIPKVLL